MPTSITACGCDAPDPDHRGGDRGEGVVSMSGCSGTPSAADTARVVVDFPNDPTTTTVRVLRTTVRR